VVLMRILVTIALVSLFASSSYAQESAESKACFDKANTQIDMNACADAELKRADTDLNHTYQALLAKNDGNATQKLRSAQRAWIVFRDAHLAELFPGKPADYGSSYAMSYTLANADTTRQRTKMLNDMLHPQRG
jgi:uncharacterized protein YecT (DUF1311 family)